MLVVEGQTNNKEYYINVTYERSVGDDNKKPDYQTSSSSTYVKVCKALILVPEAMLIVTELTVTTGARCVHVHGEV